MHTLEIARLIRITALLSSLYIKIIFQTDNFAIIVGMFIAVLYQWFLVSGLKWPSVFLLSNIYFSVVIKEQFCEF